MSGEEISQDTTKTGKHKRNPTDLYYHVLGMRIEFLRRKRDLTQEELASIIGFTRSSISNIEAGRQRILAHDLDKFCKALKTSITQLTKGTKI